MRKPLIAGNWKMHGNTLADASKLISAIVAKTAAMPDLADQTDIAILPPFLYLALAQTLLQHTAIQWGAQNLYLGTQGAFTGEVAGPMLADLGCRLVLVGHSERRRLFHEALPLVASKCQAALAAHLIPILCVGETLEEREQNKTESVIAMQITSVLEVVGMAGFANAIVAYEPVWAIGTGHTATPDQAQEMHAFIRQLLRHHARAQNHLDIAGTIRILYGGSMKAENAAELLAMPDIDGGLIGGAALDPHSFVAICEAAALQSSHLIKEH